MHGTSVTLVQGLVKETSGLMTIGKCGKNRLRTDQDGLVSGL